MVECSPRHPTVKSLSPAADAGIRRDEVAKKLCKGQSGSTVVGHSPHHPNSEGLSLAYAADIGREKMAKRFLKARKVKHSSSKRQGLESNCSYWHWEGENGKIVISWMKHSGRTLSSSSQVSEAIFK